MNETTNENFATEATAQYEPVVEVQETVTEQPKERWYQKAGKSIGARIGICASALLVVSLAAGFSAYAGASVATKGGDAKTAPMEQVIGDKGMQGLGTDSKSGSEKPSFDQGFAPDSGNSNSGNLGGKPSDMQGQGTQGEQGMGTPPSEPNSDGSFAPSGKGMDSSNTKGKDASANGDTASNGTAA